jgi:hypothetical protein
MVCSSNLSVAEERNVQLLSAHEMFVQLLKPHDLDHIFGWAPPYPTPCGFNTIDRKQYINTVDQTQYINKPTTSTCPTAQAG